MFTFGYKFRPWHELQGARRRRRRSASTSPTPPRSTASTRRSTTASRSSAADWSSAESRWTVTAVHEATGETRDLHLRLPDQLHRLLQLRRRLPAELPGADRFAGRAVHPQHWPEDLDYAGKKVVVIGSGATAVTLVPAMAGDAAHVTMLQRSPSYVFSLPAFDKISEFLGRFLPDQSGLRAGPQAQHRDPAWVLQGVPALAAADAPIPVVAGATPRRSGLRHEPLHAEVHAVGRAAVRGARRRPVRRAGLRPGLGGHRRDRNLHRDRHPAEVGPAPGGGHHRHGDRAEPADAGRHAAVGGRRGARAARPDDLQGHPRGGHPEPGVDVRIHQRTVDAEVRHRG